MAEHSVLQHQSYLLQSIEQSFSNLQPYYENQHQQEENLEGECLFQNKSQHELDPNLQGVINYDKEDRVKGQMSMNLTYLIRDNTKIFDDPESLNLLSNEYPSLSYSNAQTTQDLTFQDIEQYKRKMPDIHKQIRKEARVQQFRKKRKIMNSNDNTYNEERNNEQLPTQTLNIYHYQDHPRQDSTQNDYQLTDPQQHNEKYQFIDLRFASDIRKFIKLQYSVNELDVLVDAVMNDSDILQIHFGVIGIRHILSDPNKAYIQIVIDTGVVGKLLNLIQQDQYAQLKLEAAWCLTNIAYGNNYQIQSVLNKGAMHLFINLLRSQYIGIMEQGIWTIGNLASDNTVYRDRIIKLNGLTEVVRLIKELRKNEHHQQIYKLCTWAISNLCRGTPLPKFQAIKIAIPEICLAINSKFLDDQQMTDCCWVLGNHIQAKQKLDILIQSKVYLSVIDILNGTSSINLLIASVRILGNLSRGNQSQTDALINSNIFDYLYPLLFNDNKLLKRQCCWLISNIAAGERHQVQYLLSHQEMLYYLLEMMDQEVIQIRRQIAYIFSNICSKGDPEMILNLYSQANIIQKYCLLAQDKQDQLSIQTSLRNLYLILSFCEVHLGKKNPFFIKILQLQYDSYLQRLQYHKSDAVYKIVSDFLSKFFEAIDPLTEYE